MAPGPNGSPSLKRNIAFGRWIRHFVKKTKNGDFMKSGTVSDECFLTAFLSCWLSGFLCSSVFYSGRKCSPRSFCDGPGNSFRPTFEPRSSSSHLLVPVPVRSSHRRRARQKATWWTSPIPFRVVGTFLLLT